MRIIIGRAQVTLCVDKIVSTCLHLFYKKCLRTSAAKLKRKSFCVRYSQMTTLKLERQTAINICKLLLIKEIRQKTTKTINYEKPICAKISLYKSLQTLSRYTQIFFRLR